MSSRKYPSGAEKRKMLEKKESEKRKHRKIDQFLIRSSETEQLCTSNETEQPCTSKQTVEITTEKNLESSKQNQISSDTEKQDCDDIFNFAQASAEPAEPDKLVSSDIGLYVDRRMEDSLKKLLLSIGPHRPMGPFPRDSSNRSFSSSYYKKKLQLDKS